MTTHLYTVWTYFPASSLEGLFRKLYEDFLETEKLLLREPKDANSHPWVSQKSSPAFEDTIQWPENGISIGKINIFTFNLVNECWFILG